MWSCLGKAECSEYIGNSTGLLPCWYPRVLELSECLSYLSLPINPNTGGYKKDMSMVFCVNSSWETWRLAQRFALEGLITSSWRYGPRGAIAPRQEEVLRCCIDVTLLHFFNELGSFLICFPKRFCAHHPHYESKRDAEQIQRAYLSAMTFMLLKECMWRGVFFFSIFKMIPTLEWVFGCWVESKNAEMVVVNDWLLPRVCGWDRTGGGGGEGTHGCQTSVTWHSFPELHPYQVVTASLST